MIITIHIAIIIVIIMMENVFPGINEIDAAETIIELFNISWLIEMSNGYCESIYRRTQGSESLFWQF